MDERVNRVGPAGSNELSVTGSDSPGTISGGSLRTNPWLVCLLPFLVFMAVGSLEPTPPEKQAAATKQEPNAGANQANVPAEEPAKVLGIPIRYRDYPLVYTAKIALTLATMLFLLPGYRQMLPLVGRWRFSLVAVGVGAVGVVLWVALAALQRWLTQEMGWNLGLGTRSAFNPLEQFAGEPAKAGGFLAIRFFGLAILVPVFEEFFLRGFVMRFVMANDWWKVPLGKVNRLALVLGTAVPIFLHPGEALAAAVWFSGITWLMLRTRNIWDCVVAHGVTNLLLGAYVVASGQWWLM